MSERAHVIEIDSIVLSGVDQRGAGRLGALIEAEVRRALEGSGLHTLTGLANGETRVAGEVARTVVRSVPGGTDEV